MTGWPLVALADCCHIVSGATPKTSVAAFWDGDIDWVTPKDLSHLDGAYIHETPRRITKAGLASCGATVLPPQSVLFSSRAPIGHVAINTVPMATNQGFKSLIPHANRVDAKYLFHWLRANRSYLEGLGNGATFKEVSKAIVSRIEIPVPPLDEQRRLAAILDKADALLAKRSEALAHLDDLTQSIFLDMFGDPDVGWPIVELSDVADSVTGFAFPSKGFIEHGIRLCRGANVLPGRLDWRDLRCWPPGRAAEVSSFELEVGDVILALDRPWIGEGFKLALVESSDLPALLVQRVARLRANSRLLDQTFMYYVLQQQSFERHCRPTETTIPHISPLEVRSFEFALPAIELQRQFASQMAALGELKQRFRQGVTEMDRLFASLQARAFVGEL